MASAPDVILAATSLTVSPLQQLSRSIPIVFVQVIDPVSGGFVASLARPGGNITGFLSYEYSITGKWLQLLKEIIPGVARLAIVRDPTASTQIGQVAAIQTMATSMGIEFHPINSRNPQEALAALGQQPNRGVIVLSGASSLTNRAQIIELAARHQVPAVYTDRVWVTGGGLISYGPDRVDQYRRAAGYVDRILKGEKPADLPVQAPVKYEMVLNLKAARALGLDVPATLLARADEVIE